MKALINYFRSAVKSAQRIAELERQLKEQTALRKKYEHRVGVLEAQWENRDT